MKGRPKREKFSFLQRAFVSNIHTSGEMVFCICSESLDTGPELVWVTCVHCEWCSNVETVVSPLKKFAMNESIFLHVVCVTLRSDFLKDLCRLMMELLAQLLVCRVSSERLVLEDAVD